jgi:hypothetical protein
VWYNIPMNKKIKHEYLLWKRTAEKIQKAILKDEEAILWWLDNVHLVYDPNIEYPISEVLPLCEGVSRPYTALLIDNANLLTKISKQHYTKEDLETLMDSTSVEERLYQDLYWWNMNNDYETALKIKLKKYMLDILKAKYIDGKKLTNYARENGYVDNYPHRVMSEIRKTIRDYLRSTQKNDN